MSPDLKRAPDGMETLVSSSRGPLLTYNGSNARRQFLRSAMEALMLLACAPPLVSAAAKAEPAAMPHPLVPFFTIVDAWDHHWFLWLPHHPVYEAVEVASREPDRDGHVAVWVWFTERAGSKRQIHYRNSPQSAALVGGNTRTIDYRISGDEGRPRGVRVVFGDVEDLPVDIDVQFDPDQVLNRQRAGLTDQSGHLSDRAFLVFYRDTNAQAKEGHARIGTVNYAFARDETQGPLPFRWSYSHGISINLILYNSFKASFGPEGYAPSPETAGLYVLNRPSGGSVSLLADQFGQLKEYVDRGVNGDFLRVAFDPPLPSSTPGFEPRSSSFSISVRAAADLIRGHVESRGSEHMQVLDWHPDQPVWASKQPFRSEISKPDQQSLSVVVAPNP
jgi:hypothetical protein